jgi:predicted transcriptional regulator
MVIYSVEPDMHREIEWMAPADDYILDFLDACRCARGNPSKQTPKTIGLNTAYGRTHAGTRCRELTEHGLVTRHDRGVYSITERGEAYVAGELSVADLREVEEDDDQS